MVRTWVVAAGFALAAAITTAAPAAASPVPAAATDTSQARPAAVQMTYSYTVVPGSGRVACYGYYGTFKVPSRVMVVNWVHSSHECFGISTDRTIWHAWPGSGGWKKMGGDGHADDTWAPVQEQADGTKGVVVRVYSNNTIWAQLYHPSGGWTGVWTQATWTS